MQTEKGVLNNALLVIDPSSSTPVFSPKIARLVGGICWLPDVMYETLEDIKRYCGCNKRR